MSIMILAVVPLIYSASCDNDDDDNGGTTNTEVDGGNTLSGDTGVACSGEGAPGGCGTACGGSLVCEAGTYCNVDVCAADCVKSPDNCPGATECNNFGRCVATGTSGGGTCADVTLKGSVSTPNLIFLVDNSASMDCPIKDGVGCDDDDKAAFPPSRWAALRNFLVQGDDSFIAQRTDQLKMGLSLYGSYSQPNTEKAPAGPVPNNKNFSHCSTPPGESCPQLCSVEPALNNISALSSTDNYPLEDFGTHTPTGDSVNFLVQTLVDRTDTSVVNGKLVDNNGDEFVIILATDGAPDRCEQVDPNNRDENDEAFVKSEQAVKNAFDTYGIRVFGVFVGPAGTVEEEHMNFIGCLGGGEPMNCANDGNDRFFEVTSQEQLSNEISTLVTENVVSCTVSLEGELILPSNASCPNGGSLRLNSEDDDKDRSLSCGTDWEVLDPSTIRVLGEACDDLKESDTTLTGQFPCGAAKVI